MRKIRHLVSTSIKRKDRRELGENPDRSSSNKSIDYENNHAMLTETTECNTENTETNGSEYRSEESGNILEGVKALKQKIKDTQNDGVLRIHELQALKAKAIDSIEVTNQQLYAFLDKFKKATLDELDLHDGMQQQYIKEKLSSLSIMTEALDTKLKYSEEAKEDETKENILEFGREVAKELKRYNSEVDVIANGFKTVTLKVCTCKSPENTLKSLTALGTICTSEEHVCKSSSDAVPAMQIYMRQGSDEVLGNFLGYNESEHQSSEKRKEQIRKIKEQLQQALMLQSKEEQLQLEQLQQERVRQKQVIQEQMHHKTIEKEKQRLKQLQKRQQESNEERMRKEKQHQEQLQKEKEHQEQVRQRTEEERRSKQGKIHEMLQEYTKQEESRQDIVRQKHIRTELSRQEQMKEQERLAKLRQSQQEEVREKQSRLKDMRQEQTQKEIERQHEIQQKQQMARQEYLKQSQEQQMKNEKVRQEQLQQERLRQEKIRLEKIEQQKREEEMRLARESMIRQEKAQKEKIRQEQLLQQKQQEEKIQEQQRQLREQQIKTLKEDQTRQAELLKQLYQQIKEK